jgi:hypothetical protein
MLILSSLFPVVGVQRSKYHNAHVAQSWFLEEETPDLVAIAVHQTFAYTRTRSITTNILIWGIFKHISLFLTFPKDSFRDSGTTW